MKIHMVKKGDTLYNLAKKYNVELDALIQMNPQIADPDKIDVGMKVKIPASATPLQPSHGNAHTHIVKQGDTLYKLAKAFNISLKAMIDANPQLKNPNILMTGDTVYIPKPGTAYGVNQSGMDKVPGVTHVPFVDNMPPEAEAAPLPEVENKVLEAELMPETKHEMMPETKHEMMPETKHEMMPETKHEIMPETKHEMMPETKHEMMPETKYEMMPETKHEMMPETKHEMMPEMKHEMMAEPKHQIMPETKHEMMPEMKHEMMAEPKHEIMPEIKHQMMPEANADLKPGTYPGLGPETKLPLASYPMPELSPMDKSYGMEGVNLLESFQYPMGTPAYPTYETPVEGMTGAAPSPVPFGGSDMNQPSVNPFEQYQIPATEVASHYVLPGMPDKGEYPSNMGAHTMSFPYVPQTQGIPAPAFPVGAKDCGCGGSSAGPYAYMSNVPAYPATVGGAMYPNQPFPPAVGGAMYPNQPFPPAVGGAMYPNQPFPPAVGGAMYPNQPFPPAVGGAMYPNQPFPPAVGGAMYPNQPFPPAVGGAMYPNQPFPPAVGGAMYPNQPFPPAVGGAMYPNQPFPPAVGGAMYPNQPFPPAVGGAMYPNQPFPPAVGGAMYPNQPFPHTAAGAAAPVYPPMRGAQIYPPVNEGELYTEFDGNSLENAAEREPLPALEGQSSEQNSGRNGEARAVISIQNEEEPASPKRRPGRAKASLSQITRKQSAPARKRHKANYPWINV